MESVDTHHLCGNLSDTLTPEEKKFVSALNDLSPGHILEELKQNLKTAIAIEQATIPIYLFTYYSLERNNRLGEGIRPEDLFANKAGAAIMSVAVEEMLHMSLSANILYALGEDPQLYLNSPGSYPTPLPYHKPMGPDGPEGKKDAPVLIPLAKFSYEQLWHFLQIERPEQRNTPPKDRNWTTIGQFYSYIRCLICCKHITDAHFQVRGPDSAQYQIQSYNYSPNNVDTVSPKARFDPWGVPPATCPGSNAPKQSNYPNASEAAEYQNRADSHVGKTQLLTVSCKQDALKAILTICHQGEGSDYSQWDDKSDKEQSHYYKFLSLQAQMEQYFTRREYLDPEPKAPEPIAPTVTEKGLADVITNFPDNPTSIGYSTIYQENTAKRIDYRPLSDLCNGVYQYMYILTETIYKVPAGPGENEQQQQQKLFFNSAMHMSMIWILDKLIQTMRGFDLGNGYMLAPTFENINLGSRKDSFRNLQTLAAIAESRNYPGIQYLIDRINALPDVASYWDDADQGVSQPSQVAHQTDADDYKPGEPVPTPYPYKDSPIFAANPPAPWQLPPSLPLHACMGLNSCKGADRYGTKGHEDPNKPGVFIVNDCAGQGYCSTTADHTCHVQNACKNQGGCGLYGTGEEMENPGFNECKALGSCATPINAERFSTNGSNQGLSVWRRAREVFLAKVYPQVRQELLQQDVNAPLPEQPGSVPAPFADTGPTYLWISEDNKDRDNMTACGASGMSGAGGCS